MIIRQYIIPVIILTIAAFCIGIILGIRLERYMQREMKKRQTIRSIPRKWC